MGNMKVRKEAEKWKIENTKQIKNRHIPEESVWAFFFLASMKEYMIGEYTKCCFNKFQYLDWAKEL